MWWLWIVLIVAALAFLAYEIWGTSKGGTWLGNQIAGWSLSTQGI